MIYKMTDAEKQLADIIWEYEPIPSGQLVPLCIERLGWKKSTTYTVLRKICSQNIFKNKDTVVSSLMTKEEYTRQQGEAYLEANYNGSLPMFVAAFMKKQKLSKQDIKELQDLINQYED